MTVLKYSRLHAINPCLNQRGLNKSRHYDLSKDAEPCRVL